MDVVLLQGARAELESLRHMTSYITGQEAYKLQTQVRIESVAVNGISGCGRTFSCWIPTLHQCACLPRQVQANTRNLEDVFRSNERSSSSLEIMQVPRQTFCAWGCCSGVPLLCPCSLACLPLSPIGTANMPDPCSAAESKP